MRTLLLALLLTFPAKADDRFTRLGTALEFALPIAAGVCAFRQNRGGDFMAGLVANQVVVNTLKAGLGHAPLNIRPDGHDRGFPSGHMAAATFGATSLAQKCYRDRPGLRAATFGLAALVGLSRITAKRHNLAQVAAGAVVGFYANGVTFSTAPGEVALGYRIDF